MMTYADVECAVVDSWTFGTVASRVSMPEGMTLCAADGEYVVTTAEGKTYPTCVAQGETSDACDTSTMVCGNQDASAVGTAGQQADRLNVALTRNNFKHEDCPTVDCTKFNGYWQDTLLGSNPTVTAVMAQNICVRSDNTVMYIEADAMYNTCVGFADVDQMQSVFCDGQSFVCGGNNGQGMMTYGYPKQAMNAVARALEGDNYMHPQCPVNIC